jgi:NO-binding membrane sensor protein with MHYT domain/two-component sensor histidine kinase
MTSSYNYSLVALSVFIGMSSAYAALDLAGRVTSARDWARPAWLAGGAVVMGIGIWSMHFIGMKAFSLPVPVAYDLPTVLLSLLLGIFAASVSLYAVSRQKVEVKVIVCASVMMGVGIVSVHYVGMDAMRVDADCRYSPTLVALSVAVAIVASLVGLWLGFRFREESEGSGAQKIAGAVVAGGAISAMHYTGMAAASFVPTTMAPDLSHAISISMLGAFAIAVTTIIVQGLAMLTSYVDRQFAAQKVELLSSQLLNMQHEERRRIARDLHDDLGQALFGAKLDLGQATAYIPEGRAQKLITDIQDRLGACIEKVRTLAQLLHPPELETLGLRAAIVIYTQSFRERSGIQLDIDIPPRLPRLPLSVETVFFRVIQECLLNIQRHSKSKKAQIRIEIDSEQITLEVRDEGVGIQSAAPKTTTGGVPMVGVGLAGLAERMKQIGGRLEVTSGSWGTSVRAILPLTLSELRPDG